jgi:hypothetical protein
MCVHYALVIKTVALVIHNVTARVDWGRGNGSIRQILN